MALCLFCVSAIEICANRFYCALVKDSDDNLPVFSLSSLRDRGQKGLMSEMNGFRSPSKRQKDRKLSMNSSSRIRIVLCVCMLSLSKRLCERLSFSFVSKPEQEKRNTLIQPRFTRVNAIKLMKLNLIPEQGRRPSGDESTRTWRNLLILSSRVCNQIPKCKDRTQNLVQIQNALSR